MQSPGLKGFVSEYGACGIQRACTLQCLQDSGTPPESIIPEPKTVARWGEGFIRKGLKKLSGTGRRLWLISSAFRLVLGFRGSGA